MALTSHPVAGQPDRHRALNFLPNAVHRALPVIAAATRFSACRRYHVRRDILSLSQGFLASMVLAPSAMRGRPFFVRVILRYSPRSLSPWALGSCARRVLLPM